MLKSAPVLLFAVSLLVSSTATSFRGDAEWSLDIRSADSPAGPNSSLPQITTSSRGAVLSWVEQEGGSATLKFSERTGTAWGPARVVASGQNWFVNWADVPSVARLDNDTLVAHWLQKSGEGTYAYDVKLARSTDDGKTWSAPFSPHSDGTQTEHGFVSIFQLPGAGLGLVWLDGRAMAAGGHGAGHAPGEMSLRFGSFGPDWKQQAESPIDLRVCECCPTAAALTADGPIVAYRDRSAKEVRDIYVARLEGGKWTAGAPVHRDEWRITACPVNGPALSARGRDVALAWFTGEADRPRAQAAFSGDAGRTFGRPIRLDDEASLGRVDIELLPDGSAAAAYIEFAEKRAQFRVRRVARDGTRSAPVNVSELAGGRSSGYPRMARHGNELVFAWTDRQKGSQVRTASATIR